MKKRDGVRVLMASFGRYIGALCPPTNNVLVCMRQGNSRILVDAEHTYMQPAIDALAIRAQQRCNRSEPVVINTYQARADPALSCNLPALVTRLSRHSRRQWLTTGSHVSYTAAARTWLRGFPLSFGRTSPTYREWRTCSPSDVHPKSRG